MGQGNGTGVLRASGSVFVEVVVSINSVVLAFPSSTTAVTVLGDRGNGGNALSWVDVACIIRCYSFGMLVSDRP